MPLSVSGLVSGIDVDSVVSQISELERQPIAKLEQQEADYQVKLSSYGNLQSALNDLKSAMQDLDSDRGLASFTASSGDETLFTAAADDSAAPGGYKVTIEQLAQEHKLTSGSFAEEETVGEGALHLKIGNDAVTDISVTATDTIKDVARAINAADAGVKAAVIYDGSDYFLTLAGEETGAENVISLTVTDTGDAENTDLNGLSRLAYDPAGTQNLSQSQTPENSIITVDGVSNIQRAGNTIDDVISGVTLTLASAPDAPDNQTTLTVTKDTSAFYSKIESFVEAYNSVQDLLSTYQQYEKNTGTAGVLFGDSTTNLIRSNLRNLLGNTVSDVEGLSRLADIGITLDEEGYLEITPSELNGEINQNFDKVVEFFTRNEEGSQGFAVRMVDALNTTLDSRDGLIAARESGIRNTIDDIQDQIERIETRASASEERMRAQFQTLELLLGQYQATGDYLNQQLSSLANLSNKIAGG